MRRDASDNAVMATTAQHHGRFLLRDHLLEPGERFGRSDALMMAERLLDMQPYA
jgi:hypothetical protein